MSERSIDFPPDTLTTRRGCRPSEVGKRGGRELAAAVSALPGKG